MERRKPLPLKELQNPENPSYVPFPYPTTRDEVIADLKYAVKLHHKKKEKLNYSDKIVVKILEVKSDIHIAEIEKVSNRGINTPGDFFFFITLKNDEGLDVAYISLEACGLYVGAIISSDSKKKMSISSKNKANAIKEISSFVDPSLIKNMERIYMANNLALYPFTPTWEIVTSDNSKYYLDARDCIYKLRNEIGDVKNKGLVFQKRNIVKNELIVYDALHDQMLFLDKLK